MTSADGHYIIEALRAITGYVDIPISC